MENLIIKIKKNKEVINKKFIKELIEKTCNKMETYTKKIIELGYPEIAYDHSELSVKTFISSALDCVTNSCFLQEHYVKRENEKGAGRVDFWCNYDKIDYVIELKKTDAHYNFKTKNVIRWYKTETALIKSKRQIENAGKHFKQNRDLYGINLVLVEITSNKKTIDYYSIEKKIGEITKSNWDFYAIWTVDENLLNYNDVDWYSPGLVFIGEISKL